MPQPSLRSPACVLLALFVCAGATLAACSGDSTAPAGASSASDAAGSSGAGAGRPDDTGGSCKVASDCYADLALDAGALHGEVQCLTDVRGGYCTHTCTSDGDCCALKGECKDKIKEVCSPFESHGGDTCFLSCESGDLFPAPGQTGAVDEQEFCQREASRDFICRSSGGGSDNKKICVPGDCSVGAACASGADCASGLACQTAFTGGYCGSVGCMANADCGAGSLCVANADGKNYCLKGCTTRSDCTFCRGVNDAIACTGSVHFAEAGTTGTVCLPP